MSMEALEIKKLKEDIKTQQDLLDTIADDIVKGKDVSPVHILTISLQMTWLQTDLIYKYEEE